MADRFYLSLWLRGFTPNNMLRHFQRVLECFPYSRISPEAALRIYAIEFKEPPLMERRFDQDAEASLVIDAAREFANDDCAFQLECQWDLWQFDSEWSLTPAPVSMTCFGPEFDSDYGEQIRIEIGTDALFLPDLSLPGSATPVRSNIRSAFGFGSGTASSGGEEVALVRERREFG
jgi:hypothetical protein